MAQRASDVIGKPVVSAADGGKLGTVSDLLLDESTKNVIALVVRGGGFLKHESILPTEAIKTLGRDAVVSHSSTELIDSREWRARRERSQDVE
jgi:uncharacterized protein YrrD